MSGEVVEALAEWTPDGRKAIFIGGGITNCPDWQKVMIDECHKARRDLVLLNPRRANFPMEDPEAGRKQILWEQRHIERAHGILFWFPKETLCPITLFELGRALHSYKGLFVGCHPDYARKFDLRVQLGELRPDVRVHESLYDLADDVVVNFCP